MNQPSTIQADLGWAGIITAALAYDVWLTRKGHALLTHRQRTKVGWSITAILLGHFAGVLPWWLDPFGLVVKASTIGRTP